MSAIAPRNGCEQDDHRISGFPPTPTTAQPLRVSTTPTGTTGLAAPRWVVTRRPTAVFHRSKGRCSMTNPYDVQQMIGRTAVDPDGSKIGKIGQVYLDDQT